MKVLVFGGRVGVPSRFVNHAMDELHKRGLFGDPISVIDGRATGVDSYAHAWGRRHAFATERYPVNRDIDGHGDDAPKRRNQRMLDVSKPDLCLGFPGGPGSRDMAMRVVRADVMLWDVEMDIDRQFVIMQAARPDVRGGEILRGVYPI